MKEVIRAAGKASLARLMDKATSFVREARALLEAEGFAPLSIEIECTPEVRGGQELVVKFATRIEADHCAHWFFEHGYVSASVMPESEYSKPAVHVSF